MDLSMLSFLRPVLRSGLLRRSATKAELRRMKSRNPEKKELDSVSSTE